MSTDTFLDRSDDELRRILVNNPPTSANHETARAVLEDRKLDRQTRAAELQARAAESQAATAASLQAVTTWLMWATWALVAVTALLGWITWKVSTAPIRLG
jgi:hypothetical protein